MLCFKKSVLLSVSVGALTVSPSFAQEADVEETEARQDVVVVQGVRQSIERAVDIKRNSNTVVEAITFEDLGNFADDSIASAIQRVPGVQVETNDSGADGDRVSLRGLGPQFTNTTINGRQVLSPGSEGQRLRSVNFDVFPPAVLSGVRVAKGQTATGPEAGLAGQVNLETIKPLQFSPLSSNSTFGSVSLRGSYSDIAEEWGQRIDGLFAARNEAENFGGYVALVLGDETVGREQLRVNSGTRNVRIQNGTGFDTVSGVLVPLSATYNPIEEDRGRVAISAGLQFQPNDALDIVVDGTFTEFDNESARNRLQVFMGGIWGATQFLPGNVTIDDSNVVQAFDLEGFRFGGNPGANPSALVFDNTTTNFIGGINVDWDGDRWSANYDLSYSKVEYEQDLRFMGFRSSLDKASVSYDATGSVPSIDFGPEFLDPTTYEFNRARIRGIDLEADSVALKSLFSYDANLSAISSFDFGLEYSLTDITSDRSPISIVGTAFDPAVTAATFTGALTDPFLSDEIGSPQRWLITSYDAAAGVDPLLNSDPFELGGIDPAASFGAEEEIFSLIGQANIDTTAFGKPVTGNVGFRAVQTDATYTAATRGLGPDPIPTETGTDYWEFLPSANLNFSLSDNTALRFGYSKTLTRPEYTDSAPINIVTLPTDPTSNGTITAGNPDLDPITSQNFDITFELYNDHDGAFVASFFYKDVSDFIVRSVVQDQTFPGQGTQLFSISQPINFSDGEVTGIELGFYQPLGIFGEALSDFGIQANYTYVDSSFDEDVGDAGVGFPGASENNFNAVAFYETDLLTFRAAYVYRDDFFRELAGTGAQIDTARFTEAQGSLDLNATIRPKPGLSLSANVKNVNDEARRDYIGETTTFLDYFNRGRTYTINASYRF